MANCIGIRLEDKNEWERRVALIPRDIEQLVTQGVPVRVERFARRAFADAEFAAAGAEVVDDVRDCELVLGIKEMPKEYFRDGGAYMFFSHTIKGQEYNMQMLRTLIERKCTLLDYECVTDDEDRRLIFFGRHAGLAGMIDTLWTLGLRLKHLGYETPFMDIQPTHQYADLEHAKSELRKVGQRIAQEGIPAALAPLTFGFVGYGNVSRGAQEIFDLLPHDEIDPDDLADYVAVSGGITKRLAKVVYHEEDIAAPKAPGMAFELQDYYQRPEKYVSSFGPHLELLSVIVNGIYWTEDYPKLATAEQLQALFTRDAQPKLVVVGDISCDIDGSLECTVRDTEPGDPVYVYDPATREGRSGVEGSGIAVMAVGNLPTELPRDASTCFSDALSKYIMAMSRVDFGGTFEDAALPEPIRRSIILWRGELTPRFEYMKEFLED